MITSTDLARRLRNSSLRRATLGLAVALGIVIATGVATDRPAFAVTADDTDPERVPTSLAPVGPVTIDPSDTVGPAATAVGSNDATLALADLTGANGFGLDRGSTRRDVAVPIPDGLALVGAAFDVSVPANSPGSAVSVTADGVEIVRFVVAPGAADAVQISIEQDAIGESTLGFEVFDDDRCLADGSSVTLSDVSFVYEGRATAPTTIAEFFPSVMTSLVIVEPDDPSDAVRDGTYALAAAMARRYAVVPGMSIVRGRGDDMGVVGPGAAGVESPFERVVTVTESDEPGARLDLVTGPDGSRLSLTAGGELLAETAARLSDPEIGLLTSATSTVDPTVDADPDDADEADPAEGDDLLTSRDLVDLGVDRLDDAGRPSLEVAIPLPQSAFGQAVAALSLDLDGFASDPSSERRPNVTVWLGDRLLSVVDVADDGSFGVSVAIDGVRLGRDNTVFVRSEVPDVCGTSVIGHRLVIDGGSSVDAADGQSLPPSLDRFPQVALGPDMDGLRVAVGDSVTEQQVAATIVAALQASSPLPLGSDATTLDDATSGNTPALVVVDEGGSADAVDLLATSAIGGLTSADGVFAPGLSTIVATTDETGGDLLVVELADDDATRSLLDGLRTPGWSAFAGRVVGFDADGARTVVDAGPPVGIDVIPEFGAATTGDGTGSPFELFTLGVFLVVTATVAFFVVRSLFRILTGRNATA